MEDSFRTEYAKLSRHVDVAFEHTGFSCTTTLIAHIQREEYCTPNRSSDDPFYYYVFVMDNFYMWTTIRKTVTLWHTPAELDIILI